MSLHSPDSPRPRDDSDPLLMFATEPGSPQPAPEIPNEIASSQPPPELEKLRERAAAAERDLRESRRQVAALERRLATLVSANGDKLRSRPAMWPAAASLAAAVLAAAAGVAWRLTPAAAPAVVEQVAAAAADPALTPPSPPVAEAENPIEPVTAAAPPTQEAPLPPRPAPTPSITYVGTLSVDAVPDGGEVFINRKSVGKTPALVRGLRAGSHLVWIQREGYRRFTRVVTVPAGKVSRVSVTLERDSAAGVRH